MLYLQIVVTLILVAEIFTVIRDRRSVKRVRDWICYAAIKKPAEIIAMWRKEERPALEEEEK